MRYLSQQNDFIFHAHVLLNCFDTTIPNFIQQFHQKKFSFSSKMMLKLVCLKYSNPRTHFFMAASLHTMENSSCLMSICFLVILSFFGLFFSCNEKYLILFSQYCFIKPFHAMDEVVHCTKCEY